jgi:MFS family permease
MPAVSEVLTPLMGKPTKMYTLTACLLLPAIFLILNIRARVRQRFLDLETRQEGKSCKNSEWKNLLRKPILSILLVNCLYFTLFSSLFYLFEGFAVARGIKNPGFFFTTQMGVMIVIRLLAGRIFDKFSKVVLVAIALSVTGAGFAFLRVMPDQTWLSPIAVLFGVGMGLCAPPLNALMYLNTIPRFRGYNANMMMFVVHFGTFMGAFFGSWIIDFGGYNQFLAFAVVIAAGAAAFFLAVNPNPAQEIAVGSEN